MYYEHRARWLVPDHRRQHASSTRRALAQQEIELARLTEEEKQSQLQRLRDFHARARPKAPKYAGKLKQAGVIEDGNVFAVLVDAVKDCSSARSAGALYEVGGQYRRSM